MNTTSQITISHNLKVELACLAAKSIVGEFDGLLGLVNDLENLHRALINELLEARRKIELAG